MMTRLTFGLCLLTFSLISPTGGNRIVAADWPGFRGGVANSITEDAEYPVEWDTKNNIKWRLDLPGNGNGSPIVYQGKVFVTSANPDGSERTLHCVDRNSGEELWSKTVSAPAKEPTHKTNPYAGSTPAGFDNFIVVWHGTPGVFCYDLEGNEIWNKQLGEVKHTWGFGSSPVIAHEKVFLNYGPGVDSFLIALDLASGEELWRHNEPGGQDTTKEGLVGSWSTPVLVEEAGASQLICSMAKRVISLNPQTGKLNWECGGMSSSRGDLSYSSTVIANGIGVAMAGYNGPSLAFSLDGQGDITDSKRLWHHEKRQSQRIGSGVIVGDYLYVGNSGPAILQCINLETGKVEWKGRGTKEYWGSTVYAGGHLYATGQDGATIVFEANPDKFVKLAVNDLEEPSNGTPAFSEGEIFIRTNTALYGIGK